MNNSYKIECTIQADGKILQELGYFSDGIYTNIVRQVIDTQEQQIRDALVKLGWTPPNV